FTTKSIDDRGSRLLSSRDPHFSVAANGFMPSQAASMPSRAASMPPRAASVPPRAPARPQRSNGSFRFGPEDHVRDPHDREQTPGRIGHLHLVRDDRASLMQHLGAAGDDALASRTQMRGIEVDADDGLPT